jgi:hypothetical protein
MNLADLSATTGLALSVCALLAILGGWLKWVRPRWHKVKNDALGARDALVGREAIIDRASGLEVSPAIPGIGTRMATVEQALITLVDNEQRLTALEGDVADLKAASVERTVTKIESIAAWDAMSKAHDAQPDFIDGDTE